MGKSKKIKKGLNPLKPQQEPLETSQLAIISQSSHQHLFSDLQMPPQETNKQQEITIEPYKLAEGKGWIYKLENNNCYRINNEGTLPAEVTILQGNLQMTGKQQRQSFLSKPDSSLIAIANSSTPSSTPQQKLSSLLFQSLPLPKPLSTYLSSCPSTATLLHTFNPLLITVPTKKPWQNLDLQKYLNTGECTLIIGQKNTGKSTLCQYLLNISIDKKYPICILDLDPGRNRTFPASISLTIYDTKIQTFSIWLGQFTPLNNIPTFIAAVRSLYAYYKMKYFTHSLVINTMGYLTGIGQLILYEIYQICSPKRVVGLQTGTGTSCFENIKFEIEKGNYRNRLLFSAQTDIKTSSKFFKHINFFASTKQKANRFETHLKKQKHIKSIDSLLTEILSSQMSKFKTNKLYFQNKDGTISQASQNFGNLNMRLVIIGEFWNQFVRVMGVGYGWDNYVWFDKQLVEITERTICLITENVDMQRHFYQINESRMIQLEDLIGDRMPFLSANIKTLGNKGMRNNPAKKNA